MLHSSVARRLGRGTAHVCVLFLCGLCAAMCCVLLCVVCVAVCFCVFCLRVLCVFYGLRRSVCDCVYYLCLVLPYTQTFPLYLYRSHFGSRYKLGCCGHAGLFAPGSTPACYCSLRVCARALCMCMCMCVCVAVCMVMVCLSCQRPSEYTGSLLTSEV